MIEIEDAIEILHEMNAEGGSPALGEMAHRLENNQAIDRQLYARTISALENIGSDDAEDLRSELEYQFGGKFKSPNPPEGGIPEGSTKKERFPDGNEFDLHTCNHTELPEDEIEEIDARVEALQVGAFPEGNNPPDSLDEFVEVEVTTPNQGPLIPPWARFTETFNTNLLAPVALAHSVDEYEDRAEILRPSFGYQQRALAANRGRKEGKINKAVPLPLTTDTRLRVETLDETMQGWAYPMGPSKTSRGTGRYLVIWSNGEEEEVNRKDVHWIRSVIRGKDVLHEFKRITS